MQSLRLISIYQYNECVNLLQRNKLQEDKEECCGLFSRNFVRFINKTPELGTPVPLRDFIAIRRKILSILNYEYHIN